MTKAVGFGRTARADQIDRRNGQSENICDR